MKHKGMISGLTTMLLWGLLFPMVKLGYRFFGIVSIGDILTFAGCRFLICGGVITVFAQLRSPGSLLSVKNNWVGVLLSGLFAIILHYACTYTGLSMTDGSKTAILKQLGAVFYICFSAIFFPEDKLTVRKLIGLSLGLCGILAINSGAGGIHISLGDILSIGASFCTVFSNITSKKVFASVEPIAATGVSQLFGGAVLLLVGILAGGRLRTVIPSTAAQLGIFAAISGASVVSYCLWFLVVKKEDLSKLFLVKFAEPLFAAVFGCLLLGEDIFNLRYIAAFLLISGGIAIANMKSKQQ